MQREPLTSAQHLTEGDLFTLAVPPAGEPEALPRHLSECSSCSRALSEWKTAVRDLAGSETDVLSRRTPREWEALENRTLEAIRGARVGGRRRLGWWAAAVAAAVLLFAVALPVSRTRSRPTPGPTLAAQFTTQDQEDDLLLRDVARLSRADEETGGSWNSLAPEPDKSRAEEERL
jgi:hypothetical protein